MIDGNMILAGQLLAIAFACGLNLYATVAILALASRLGIAAELPPGMSGLENGVVIGIALTLLAVELIIDRVRYAGAAWQAVHTLIRPAAAGLLAGLALQSLTPTDRVAGAAAAALMALGAHTSTAGIHLILSTRIARPRRRALVLAGVTLLEDAVAVGIVTAALLEPTSAVPVVAGALALLVITGPRLWRAAALGIRALYARLRGFFDVPGWRGRDQLPRAVRAAIPVEPLGRGPARAVSAAVTGLPRVGAYTSGWLVLTWNGPRFVHRSLFGMQSTPLPHARDIQLRTGTLTDTLEVRTNGDRRGFTLFLLKDGPPAHIAAAELTSVDT